MFGVSSSTIPNILSFATGLFGDLFPFIALILGIVIFFWVFELMIGWLHSLIEIRAEKAEAFETGLMTALKALKIKPKERIEAIAAKARKEPAIAKAIELHRRFKELMAE